MDEVMKAYTDIEQSKKLAEILPIESADMWWAERYAGRVEGCEYIVKETPIYYMSFTKPSEENWSQDKIKDIPCWSLAALLDYLSSIDVFPTIENDDNQFKLILFILSFVEENEESLISDVKTIIVKNKVLVDACVEMIVKLKSINLL